MNLNKKIISLMKSIKLPAEESEYTGIKKNYVVFTYEDEKPVHFGDNCALADTCYIQLQLITPKEFNYFNLKKKVRDALESAGFFVTSTRTFLGDVYQETEKTRQTVFECSYTETRNQEE